VAYQNIMLLFFVINQQVETLAKVELIILKSALIFKKKRKQSAVNKVIDKHFVIVQIFTYLCIKEKKICIFHNSRFLTMFGNEKLEK
jgi:hypothetical protein